MCSSPWDHAFAFVYVWLDADNYAATAPAMGTGIRRWVWKLAADGYFSSNLQHSLLPKAYCGGIASVHYTGPRTPDGSANFADIVAAVRNAGYNAPWLKYVIYFDHGGPGGAKGVADMTPDSRASVLNVNNNWTPTPGAAIRASDPITPSCTAGTGLRTRSPMRSDTRWAR